MPTTRVEASLPATHRRRGTPKTVSRRPANGMWRQHSPMHVSFPVSHAVTVMTTSISSRWREIHVAEIALSPSIICFGISFAILHLVPRLCSSCSFSCRIRKISLPGAMHQAPVETFLWETGTTSCSSTVLCCYVSFRFLPFLFVFHHVFPLSSVLPLL